MENLRKKIDSRFIVVLIAVGVLAGWQYMLFLTIAVFLLTDDENLKELLIKTLIFMAAIELFRYSWYAIKYLADFLINAVDGILEILISWKLVDTYPVGFTNYVVNPAKTVISVLSTGVTYLVYAANLSYIASLLLRKKLGYVFNKIDEFTSSVSKNVLNAINK